MASYDLNYFPAHPPPNISPYPPRHTTDNHMSHPHLEDTHQQHHLSPFQQTLREQDEKFYQTFPDARHEPLQGSDGQVWRTGFNDGDVLTGYSFPLEGFGGALHYSYPLPGHDLPQASHSSLSCAVKPSVTMQQQEQQPHTLHTAQVQQNQHTTYVNPYAPPTNVYPDTFPSAAPFQLPVAPSAPDISHHGQYHQHNQYPPSLSSPVMDSLTPATSSDPSPFQSTRQRHHTPPNAYHRPPPFNLVSSPAHLEPSSPLSPPELMPATYPQDINAARRESEHLLLDQRLPHTTPPQPPSRRDSRESYSRPGRRPSVPYTRPPNHRPGGSRSAPMPSPDMIWPPPSPNVAPTMGLNSNVSGEAFVMINSGTTSAGQAAATIAPNPALSSISSVSGHGKRNPDKKPALACVFCRGRKIACGPPPKDGDGKTCNQCSRRSLPCEYPTESRRGMRKKPSTSPTSPGSPSTPAAGASKTSNTDGTTSNPKSNPEAPPKAAANKKR
ncbi:hypothetical protein D9756_005250 [Leucocoprinus leucothites]|uniref:Zn(2)-C6 fungal-type domain-containing protein n=1 Tax=Leucocoprinus leucothites TaxID=201217 RepID=A0A8H5FZV5_9AGAR|nr:hypothetical protein D9756_005250 [Leucoagaricus leucothites]